MAVRTDDLAHAETAVAAPEWHLAALGLQPTAITLHRPRHVMATAPGENRWIATLDAFLDRETADVADLLRASVEARP